jgi:hypothetical protein
MTLITARCSLFYNSIFLEWSNKQGDNGFGRDNGLLIPFLLQTEPSGLPQHVAPLIATYRTCFSETSCPEWQGAISPRPAGESHY